MNCLPLVAAFDCAPTLQVMLDQRGKIVASNRRFRLAFGEIEGLGFDTVLVSASPGLCSFVRRMLAKGAEFRIDDMVVRTPNAGELRVEAHGARIGENQSFLLALVDQTERVTAATARAQRERSETIARFAGGLSHDLNNMLSAVVTTAQAAILDSAESVGDPVRDFRAIMDLAQRCAALARSLRAIAFDETGSWRPVDVADEIRAVSAIVGRGSSGVPMVIELGAGVPLVVGDRARIHQLVLNLLVNARDAVQDRAGIVEVELLRSASGGVRLIVSDSGPGVPPELREQIFQPYFSTKHGGEEESWGRGLGLVIVDAVARATHAVVSVDSSRSGGARFSVEWPLASVAVLEVGTVRPTVPVIPLGVLLVQHVPALLESLAWHLRKRGHRVIAVASLEDARRAVVELEEALDLAVVELAPQREGTLDWVRELRTASPNLGVVFTSNGGRREVSVGIGVLDCESVSHPIELSILLAAMTRARLSRRQSMRPG